MARRVAFDPLRTYTAARTFVWGGKTFKQGEPFNDRRDMRRFRQLYDSRYLTMGTDDDAPNFVHMREPQLLEWLTEHGRPNLAHPRTPHVRLVERCKRVWRQLKEQALATPTPALKTPRVKLPAPPTATQAATGNRVRL